MKRPENEFRPGATGAKIAIASLEANNVEVDLRHPGRAHAGALRCTALLQIRHVLARHEQGVGFMADGYARASGRPGVAVVITGPGVTNIATAVGEAYTDSSPVLVLSSNVQRAHVDDMRGNLHDLKDQLGVMAAVTKWNTRVMSSGRCVTHHASSVLSTDIGPSATGSCRSSNRRAG